jgi:hypothetical protein
MSGARGPTFTLQTPFSSLLIGCGLPSSSPLTVTCFAFGAEYRKVIVRSAPTSGEMSCGPPLPCPAPAGAWALAGEQRNTDNPKLQIAFCISLFLISRIHPDWRNGCAIDIPRPGPHAPAIREHALCCLVKIMAPVNSFGSASTPYAGIAQLALIEERKVLAAIVQRDRRTHYLLSISEKSRLANCKNRGGSQWGVTGYCVPIFLIFLKEGARLSQSDLATSRLSSGRAGLDQA